MPEPTTQAEAIAQQRALAEATPTAPNIRVAEVEAADLKDGVPE